MQEPETDSFERLERLKRKGAGGSEGGVGEFFLGFLLAVAGGYLLLNQVTVTSGGWRFFGYSAFGLSLAPFFIGLALLFYNGRSIAGWLLTAAGIVIIFAGILTSMDIFFRPTSLYNTLLMIGLLAAGVGLVARSPRPH